MADFGGLLGGTQASAAGSAGEAPIASKRRKLRHYDLLPAQLINSMGASGIELVDLPRLWDSMSAGNKVAEAFSELCFAEPERQGVGLSRLAEVMMHTIERLLTTPHYEANLKEELWTAVKTEAEELLPSMKALYAGRGGTDDRAASIRSVAYQRKVPSCSDLRPHATKLHDWLSKANSPLRSVIALFSAGGLFYVAQCHEKGARAWLASGATMEHVHDAVNARRPVRPAAEANDYGGLSQPEL